MSTEQNQPREFDVVLGGETPPPLGGAVLGGIEGVKNRLASTDIEAHITALNEALNYGNIGIDFVIKELDSKSRRLRHHAANLLQSRQEIKAKLALKNYKFWIGFEKLNGLPNRHVTTFANRKVIEYDYNSSIITGDTLNTAFALRSHRWRSNSEGMDCADKFKSLVKNYHRKGIEALVFGLWHGFNYNSSYHPVANALAESKRSLKNLKAVFIGDIEDSECMISSITQSNVTPILEAYPNLEVLKIRGDSGIYPRTSGLAFDPLRHNKLKALIIESGGLRKETVNQICNLVLPELQYLELWLGRDEYGGTSSIEDVMPIINGVFPKLKYLGLRNSEYSDDIATALVHSPILDNLIELDFSMGTLGDEAAEALLSCPKIHYLDTLDISENCLSDEMIQKLKQLDIEIIANGYQKDSEDRYCSVAE
ncbi:hypothetical protein CAL7716_103460 (plasmid) [Calothrix sp. PCC 7716]|nr:hypothetical protein CAL7716_103460 [Calothrix sp. PCC 7716]